MEGEHCELTFRVVNLESMLLERDWRSEMWPETAERSCWKVARKDSRDWSMAVLLSVCSWSSMYALAWAITVF